MNDDDNESWSSWYKPRNPFLESATASSSNSNTPSNPTLFKSSLNTIKVIDPSKWIVNLLIMRGNEKAELGNMCKGLRECSEEVNNDKSTATNRLSCASYKEEQVGFIYW